MSILIFGSSGQLAKSLHDSQPTSERPVFLNRDDCDLADSEQVIAQLETHKPALIINAAAYTQVDNAEEERALAHRVNSEAVETMARYARTDHARLIHVSTDFVFDGDKDAPYQPGDSTRPLGEYGASKLAGEVAALKAAPESTMIIRTSWLYSEHGRNFVNTMLRLMADRDELGVVDDQRGSPTYARGLAAVIWQIINNDLFAPGIYHWTDQGNITWHDFAVAIQEEALKIGLLDSAIPIKAITTEAYPTPASRPANSVLDNKKLAKLLGSEPTPWRENLELMLSLLTASRSS